jgi:hypothetical protein
MAEKFARVSLFYLFLKLVPMNFISSAMYVGLCMGFNFPGKITNVRFENIVIGNGSGQRIYFKCLINLVYICTSIFIFNK